MTNEEIQALQALARRATRGPWKTHLVDSTCVVSPAGEDVCTTCDSSQAEREDGYNIDYERMEADAAFIAATRYAVPKICRALLAARKENEAWKRISVDNWRAFSAMRDLINECVPMQSPEADLLSGPEFHVSCEVVTRAVVERASDLATDLLAAMAEVARLREALESIRQYGSDTLSGPADGPDDRNWQRDGVWEMTRRACTAMEGGE